VGFFPDAPTERGTKHLGELTKALKEGYISCIAFVIQGEGIEEVRPNAETDPAFASAYFDALKAGVKVLFLKCSVTESTLQIIGESNYQL
jgi:sugar fermentation stimulation protein A